jgi:tripeptidyl-peptidase-1
MYYHRIFVLYILAAALSGLSLVTALTPDWHEIRTKHSWPTTPNDWEWVGPPKTDTTIDLYVALKSHREDALIDALYEVSTPEHPKQVFSAPSFPMYSRVLLLWSRYGQHLTKEEVAKLVAPHPDTLNLVHAWLDYSGIPSSSISESLTHGGSSLKLTGVPISQANDFLGASYQLYRHVETNETIVRTTGYALPVVLHDLIQTVVPTTCFGFPQQKPRKSFGKAEARPRDVPVIPRGLVSVPSSRDVIDVVTPAFLRWLYNTWVYTPLAPVADRIPNMIGIVGYLYQFPSLPDLRMFMQEYRSDGADATFTVALVNNGEYDPNRPGHEANLDMQYAQGLAYPIQHIFYSTGRGPSGTEDWYLSWLETIINEPFIPRTISLSYGNNEAFYPMEYVGYVCRLFGLLGARGISVLQASGDNGVGPRNCRDRSGNIHFMPTFPGTCMYRLLLQAAQARSLTITTLP